MYTKVGMILLNKVNSRVVTLHECAGKLLTRDSNMFIFNISTLWK